MTGVIRIGSLSAFAIILSPMLSAGEFGNAFSSHEVVQEQSRIASAEAIGAIQNLMEGLRLRELGQSEGSEAFLQAAEQLFTSSKLMSDLTELEGFPSFDLTGDEQQEILEHLSTTGISVDFPNSFRTFRDAYANFAHLQVILAEQILTSLDAVGADERFYGRIASYVEALFFFADFLPRSSQARMG